MNRVLVLVEGQTEERFVKDVLREHFWEKNIDITPKIATTKRVKNGSDFKGGLSYYGKVENDIKLLLGDTGAKYITTFLDYYALPSDFPGMNNRPTASSYERAVHVEKEFKIQIDNQRFYPFLMVHEFEALLFSKPLEIVRSLNKSYLLKKFDEIKNSFKTPEDINDSPLTAPSKRIINYCPEYQKNVHGPLISKRIGLETILSECPHFKEWYSWLSTIAD